MDSPLDKAIARLPEAVDSSIRKMVQITARDMLAEPWRLCRALHPYAPRTMPPTDTPSLIAMLAEVRSAIRSEQRSADQWWSDFTVTRLITLRGVEEAILTLIERNAARLEQAARAVA